MAVNVDFGLAGGAPDVAARVQQGFDLGRQQRDQANLRRALGVLSADPTDPAARAMAMSIDPQILPAIDNAAWQRQAHQQADDYRSGLRDRLLAVVAPPSQPSGAVAALMGGPTPQPQPIADGSQYGRVDVTAPAPAAPSVGVPGSSPTLAALLGHGAGLPDVSASPAPPPDAAAPAPALPDLPPGVVAAASAPPSMPSAPVAPAAAPRDAALARMIKADPERAMALMETERAQQTARRTAQLDLAAKVNAEGLRLLSTARDQASYDVAGANYNAFLAQYGLPPANLPKVFSPETLRGLQLQALDVKDQIAAAKEQATLEETHRHNVATEDSSKFKTVIAKPGEVIHVYNESTGEVDTVAKDGGDGETPPAAHSGRTPAASSAPRSVRNNNPGNLRASGWTQKQPGFVGADGAGYARFDSVESGQAAQAALLRGKGYMAGGRNTVQSIIEKWAPRASAGGDNTDAQVNNYIAYVAKQLGVKPGQPLPPEAAPQLAAAMSQIESGATGHAGTTRVPASSAIKSASGGGSGWPISGPPLQSTALDDNAIQQVAAAYKISKVMPPIARDKEMVKRILNASAAMTLQQAHDIADGQVQTWQDTHAGGQAVDGFAKGPLGNQTRSLNVAIQHVDQLRTAAAALQNGNIPAFNAAAQALAKATGRPAPTTFDALKQFVLDEVTKGIIGTAGGVSDREEANRAISKASSPQQIIGVLDGAQGLLAGQANGLRQQYHAATGRDDYADKYLLPRTRQLLLGQHGGGSGDIPVMTPDQVRAAPSGTVFRTTDGRTMRKR